jgi:YbbR domain-containing protein
MAYYPFRNLALKFLAISLAVLLWFTVSGEPTIVERGLRIPLEFQNIPDGLEIVGDMPDTIDVRVRGSSAILSRLEPGEVVAVLDLQTARPGSRLFDLVTEQVRAPFGVDVAQVAPATIALDLERSGPPREVPVVPAVEGEPAPGYVVGEVSSEPATVLVVGPESRLQQLTEVMTEPVVVAGATAPVTAEVTVGVPDLALRLSVPRRAVVTVDVVPAPAERTLREVPVHVRNVSAQLAAQVVPPVVTVRVRGSRPQVQSLRSDSVDAFIDLAGLGSGSYNLTVQAEAQGQLGVVDVEPPVVQVTLQ